MGKNKKIYLIFCFVLLASPLLFGSRHPLIHGLFNAILLLAAGTWVAYHFTTVRDSFNLLEAVPPVIISWVFLTAVPLPFFFLETVSATRAGHLAEGMRIAQLDHAVTSLSYFAPDTVFYGVFLLALYLYYLAATNVLAKRDQQQNLLWLIMVVGLAEAAYGLLQAMDPTLGVLWLSSQVGAEGSARGTIIYRNQYAALLNMCWPMSVVLGASLYQPALEKLRFKSKKKDRPAAVDSISLLFHKAALPFWAAAFMMLAVIFSSSRGGIMVMLLQVGLLVALLPFARRSKSLVAATFAAFILLYGGLIGFDRVADRFLEFYQGALFRIGLWLDSLRMLTDHLFSGIGMGGYRYLSLVYLDQVPDNAWFDFAHNEYVELLIELGAPMMVLLVAWMIYGMVRQGLFIWRQRGTGQQAFAWHLVLATGTFCGLTGFLAHGLVDFVWRLPVNAIYAVTLLALLSGARQEEHHAG